jgi:hypothetical protein
MDYKSFYSPYAIRAKLNRGQMQYLVLNTLTGEAVSRHKAWSKAYQTWLDVNAIYKRKSAREREKFVRTRL